MTDEIDDALVQTALDACHMSGGMATTHDMHAAILSVAPAIMEMERRACAQIAQRLAPDIPDVADAILARGERHDG